LRPHRRGGGQVRSEPVVLLLEEYESIKLCDYDLMNHNEASQFMGVSRPTFSRIYSRARQKVAKSFVEVREIIVEGGKVYYDSEWFECKNCGCDFNNSDMFSKSVKCPLCGSDEIINITADEDIKNNKCNEN
jgi:predicted DNA-binding protein (UPF0251 family)